MNFSNRHRDQWLTLLACMLIALIPMIGLGIGYLASPQESYILRSIPEGVARSLSILSFAFYVFPALVADMIFESLRGHSLFGTNPSYTFMAISFCIQSLLIGGIIWLFSGRHKTPSKMFRRLWILTVIYFAINFFLGWAVYASHAEARIAYDRLMATDHPRLLSACRYMIANKDLYTNDCPYSITQNKNYEIELYQEQIKSNKNVPSIIQEMNPTKINLSSESLMVKLACPPRLYFIAYEKQANQRGTRCLIDGLWYYNGTLKEAVTKSPPCQ